MACFVEGFYLFLWNVKLEENKGYKKKKGEFHTHLSEKKN